MAQPVVVALVCSTLVFIHFGFYQGKVLSNSLYMDQIKKNNTGS